MFERTNTIVSFVMAALLAGSVLPALAADEAVDKAFEALKTYQWGQDRNVLGAIDKAVAASHGNQAARMDLQMRLAAVLKTDSSHAAKDFVCRKLSLIGSAKCVPAVAVLLTDKKLSHMARYALERIPGPEAVGAMHQSLPKVSGLLKVGMINSLGVRRNAQSTGALVALLKDSDQEVVAAAAAALGSIGTPEVAKVLRAFQAKAPQTLRLAAADAQLTCAERLLADGKKVEAMAIYRGLAKTKQPKHVRLAAMRGLLAATGKK